VARVRRRLLAVLPALLALVATAALAASAATVGRLSSEQLGASRTTTASCSTSGVGVAYTTAYDRPSGGYQVTGVTLSDLAPECAGKAFRLTVEAGAATSETPGTVAPVAGTQFVPLASPVAASMVTGASLVVTG
jgi:hypothetical protein